MRVDTEAYRPDVGNMYRVTENGIRRLGRDMSGKNCFCVVMDIVNDIEEGEETVTVGTVLSCDSLESGYE